MEINLEVPLKKLKTELPDDLAIPFLGIYPNKYKSGYNRESCMPMFITEVFTIPKLCEQSRFLSTNQQIK
jgi:hypothetical protein